MGLVSNKPRPIITLTEIHLERIPILRELRQVLFRDRFLDVFLLCRINQGDAGAFEAGAGEAAAVDAVGGEHSLVDRLELGAAAFVVVDAGVAAGLAQGAEPFQVAGLPGGDAFADAFVFAVEVLGAPSKARRHFVAMTLVHALRDIAQEGLVVGLQGHVFIGLDNPGGGLAFRNAEVVVAGHKATGQAAEEDAQLEVRHIGRLRDESILVGLAIKHEQMVLLPQGDASLIQQTIVQADVLPFSLGRNPHDFEGFQADAIGLGKSHHISDEDGGAAAEPAHRQRSLDDTADAPRELEPLLQRKLRPPRIIAPIPLLHQRRRGDIELDMPVKSLAIQHDLAVLPHIEPKVHALINGKPRHQPVLVIHMRAQRADAVGGEDVVGHRLRIIYTITIRVDTTILLQRSNSTMVKHFLSVPSY